MKTIKAYMARAERLGIRRANRTNVHGACVPQFNHGEVLNTINVMTHGELDRVQLNILVDAACAAHGTKTAPIGTQQKPEPSDIISLPSPPRALLHTQNVSREAFLSAAVPAN
jgi:hypothetical protein